jgi:protein SCO1
MNRPARRLASYFSIAAVALLALTACGGTSYVFKGGEITPLSAAAPIDLTDQREGAFSLADQRGKVVLLYFGYTTCPDACPTTLSDWVEVKRLLGDKADDVVFVMVTVDPERDTPAKLEKYMNFFDGEFYGLTGTPEQITEIEQAYGIVAIREEYPNSATKYLMNHTTSTLVIDADGKLRLNYAHGTDPEVIAEDVEHLIK